MSVFFSNCDVEYNFYILLFFIFHIQIRHHCFSILTHQNHGKHETNTIVILNKVSSNERNAYNATSGILTAPVDGICSFSWEMLTNGGKYFITDIMLNGRPIAFQYTDNKGRVEYSMSSSHFNIKLRKMIKCGYKLVPSMGRMFMVESSAIFL